MTELELRAHRIEAIGAIENLMSLHAYYHAADQNREELLNCWSKTRGDEIIWSQNFGRWQGMHKLMPMYAGDNKYTDAEWLKSKIVKAHPEMEEALKDIDGRALAEMPVHTLASPIIEVSADGMSAKGVWYTPGFALRHDYVNGTANVTWMWEKYGGDFIYEDGEWRFLRLLIGMDMVCGADDGCWTEPKKPMGPPPEEKKEVDPDDPDGKRGKSPAMGGAVTVEKDEPGRYTDYKPTRIPTETPRLPEPFESLDKTWSY